MHRLAALATLATLCAPSPARAADGDLVLYEIGRADQGDAALYNLVNLVGRGVLAGLAGNGARTGLGTRNPTGRALEGEGLYYQGLRIYSYFDQAFQRALVEPGAARPLPDRFVVLAGRFPQAIADTRSDEQRAAAIKLRKAARLVVPELAPFSFRRFSAGDFDLDVAARRLRFSDALRGPLDAATLAKLADLAQKTYRADASPVRDKLIAMLGAFAPLSTQFYAGFDDATRQHSFTRLRVILPAYQTLEAPDVDHPETWYLEKGLRPHVLPRPVQIMMAQITGLRYLQEADPSLNQAISLEIRRDFEQTDRLTTVARFGVLAASEGGELLDVDTSDPRNALYVTYRLHLEPAREDSAVVRWAKGRFNDAFGVFEVDARIHELTLRMIRSDATNGVLRPYFSLDESKISFRAHRRGAGAAEQLALRAMGFACAPAATGHDCWQDFWTWDAFRDQLLSGQLVSTSGLGAWIQSLVNKAVGFATREVLDRSIPNIEDAIDDEVARLGEEFLDRVTTARNTLTDRLHGGLF